MPDNVTDWLEQLGLAQYAEAFEENAIELAHLPNLDHEVLLSIGVRAAGHRMTILGAAATLGLDPGEGPTSEKKPPASVTEISGEAERRQLTVMFCDLVGSTELSQRLDLEDLREVNRTYQDACTAAIERYDGYVARYMGDGVLAYFGYPRAHEDDAERAVRAGLGIVEVMPSLNRGDLDVELAVRVGIATGPVVVGDLIGEGASQESAVVGETPNLAARLQAEADPNTVLIAAMTKTLIGEAFDHEDLGWRNLRGINRPVQVWRVTGEQASTSRFEARSPDAFTAYVGREAELAMLEHRWMQAKDGEGQVVLLSGEPGIGKSRMVMRLTEAIDGQSHTRMSYQCSPFHANSPLHPVTSQLQGAARFRATDSPDDKLDKLERLLGRGDEGPASIVALLAGLLSISGTDRYPPLSLTPQQHKQRTLAALVDRLARIARAEPVLMLFEDLHWVDPTTQEFLDITVAAISALPVLLVATFRPEFQPPWLGQPNTTMLQLSRLNPREGEAMVRRVRGAQALSDEVVADIVDKTDGVPLFVEELARTVIDVGPDRATAVPASLHASLLARLDQLGDAKELAQIGAVIGRDFSYELLSATIDQDEQTLRVRLERLVTSGLVLVRGTAPQSTYRFKHALVQDAAYDSLLRAKKRLLHHAVAQALERRFPAAAQSQPELLAHHRSAAGDIEKAIGHWLDAGRRATQQSANREAVAYLRRGLEALTDLPSSTARDRLELSLQLALFTPLPATTGFASKESMAAYDRVRELCDALDTPEQLYPALLGQWVGRVMRGEPRAGLQLAAQMHDLGEQTHNEIASLLGYRMLGWCELFLGQLADSRIHLRSALELYDPERHAEHRFQMVHDHRVATTSPLAMNLLLSGFPTQAMATSEETIDYARRSGHTNTLAYALVHGGVVPAMMAGDVQRVGSIATELDSLEAQAQLPHLFVPWNRIGRGWSMARSGEPERGIALMCEGIEQHADAGVVYIAPVYLCLLADVYVETKDLESATVTLRRAMSHVEQTEECFWEAEVHRHMGNAQLARSPDAGDLASTHFRAAIGVARSQGAKLLELRAAVSLAHLLRQEGRAREALDLLEPVYASFTEGFDTPDLLEAETLLAQLAE